MRFKNYPDFNMLTIKQICYQLTNALIYCSLPIYTLFRKNDRLSINSIKYISIIFVK